MSIELIMLLAATMLVASLWIPYIVGVNMHPIAGADPFARPPDHAQFPDWVQRANRAHLNLVEQYVPFAGAILIAHVLGVTSTAMQVAAIAFVGLRLAHAIGMIMGWARMPVRPVLFTAGYLATIIICAEVVRLSFS
ncbi:MAG: MAPEG family protein [Hyphomicrobiales bacterium]